jgi:hypothetical protein
MQSIKNIKCVTLETRQHKTVAKILLQVFVIDLAQEWSIESEYVEDTIPEEK